MGVATIDAQASEWGRTNRIGVPDCSLEKGLGGDRNRLEEPPVFAAPAGCTKTGELSHRACETRIVGSWVFWVLLGFRSSGHERALHTSGFGALSTVRGASDRCFPGANRATWGTLLVTRGQITGLDGAEG